MERDIIIRHSAPSALDESKYGTQCIVYKTEAKWIWIQVSKDSVDWELLGTFNNGCPLKIIDELVSDRLR